MKKDIIAVDFDDVLVETAPFILQDYKNVYGIEIKPQDFYSADINVWGTYDNATAAERVEKYLKTSAYQSLTPRPDAVTAIPQLATKYDLHIVTGRADFLQTATHAVCNRYFPGAFTSIEFTNFFSGRSRPKALVCQEIGAQLLIDDHLYHAETVAISGVPVLLFGNYPWNDATVLPPNVTRVADWDAIIERLMG